MIRVIVAKAPEPNFIRHFGVIERLVGSNVRDRGEKFETIGCTSLQQMPRVAFLVRKLSGSILGERPHDILTIRDERGLTFEQLDPRKRRTELSRLGRLREVRPHGARNTSQTSFVRGIQNDAPGSPRHFFNNTSGARPGRGHVPDNFELIVVHVHRGRAAVSRVGDGATGDDEQLIRRADIVQDALEKLLPHQLLPFLIQGWALPKTVEDRIRRGPTQLARLRELVAAAARHRTRPDPVAGTGAKGPLLQRRELRGGQGRGDDVEGQTIMHEMMFTRNVPLESPEDSRTKMSPEKAGRGVKQLVQMAKVVLQTPNGREGARNSPPRGLRSIPDSLPVPPKLRNRQSGWVKATRRGPHFPMPPGDTRDLGQPRRVALKKHKGGQRSLARRWFQQPTEGTTEPQKLRGVQSEALSTITGHREGSRDPQATQTTATEVTR
eukprot:9159982-Pyramimonas_sp.AAC.1